MTTVNIPEKLLDDYHGCGAYLVALKNEGVMAIALVPERPRYRAPVFPAKRGRLTRDEAAARRAAELAVVELFEADLARWRSEMIGSMPADAERIAVADGSCCQLVDRYSDLAWQAHDAISGECPIMNIMERERAARVRAAAR